MKKQNSLKGLQAESGKLIVKQDMLYAESERIKKFLKEIKTVKGTADK